MKNTPAILAILGCMSFVSATSAGSEALVVEKPPTGMRNRHYVSNREPLAPSPLVKLPIGSVRPRGWLRHQLELQAQGFHGHLTEISQFLQKEGNAWLSPTGEGERGWEEVPYWLKGYLNVALVLNDKQMLAEAKTWVEGALNSQQPDGWFGPDKGRTGLATDLKGREDLWPNMVMLFCFQDYYDVTKDPRVLTVMTRYFRYLQQLPEENYLVGYWPRMRGGDNLFSIYWLYNRTGEKWLLELAEKNHRRTARWDTDVINWHNVNIAQAFGEGATWWMQSQMPGDIASAERNWQKVRDMYGQVPGGMFGGDENCRPGYDDPRQAIETCGIVEEMLSDETLLAITGDLVWADRCEDAAYNSLPAALTADLKALRYLTAPNQVVSDSRSHSPGIQNSGPMFQMNPHRHRCCQHNFGHGWPYFAQHLWFATADDGLAAVFYNECSVVAKVGGGTEVTIEQQTRYPFEGKVKLTLHAQAPVSFPLYLRVPGWCQKPAISVNGEPVRAESAPKRFVVLSREWKSGDRIELDLPLEVGVRTWKGNHNSVSIDRGPLTFSLEIGENYVRSGGTDEWPAFDILPTNPWNYALEIPGGSPKAVLETVVRSWPENGTPWTRETTPILLKAKGRKVPQWTLDKHGLCSVLQDSPVRTTEPEEELTLIPMGAARLRVSAFPVVGAGPDAKPWSEGTHMAKTNYAASASHTFGSDSVQAIADGILPTSSADPEIPRHTFWPRRGTTEWLQADFTEPKTLGTMGVYWFDDTGRGHCRIPKSFRLLYKEGEGWKHLTGPDGTEIIPSRGLGRDRMNTFRVQDVKTTAVRMEIELQPEFSAGVLEWQID